MHTQSLLSGYAPAAHCCIYKFMFYIYLMKYLFNISEYKAMLIKLLIYHRNI